jgi:formate dehydrogenase major subunit
VGKRVVVIGGGNVAFDCARSALRLGSSEVSILCLEDRQQMVASTEEIEQAVAEGITLLNSKTCTRILGNNGGTTGIECRNVKSFRFDEEGQVHIDSVTGSEMVLAADTVISATGQLPDLGFSAGTSGFRVTRRHTLEVNPVTLAAGVEGIFAAGDVVTGSKSVAAAVGGGRQAAISIHSYLTRESGTSIDSVVVDTKGDILVRRNGLKKKRVIPQHIVTYDELLHLDYFERKPRVETRQLPSTESRLGFVEIDKGYTRWQAIEEASRCFHCGHCFQCETCVDICPDDVYRGNGNGTLVAYPDDCCYCGCCVMDCPCSAITIRTPLPMRVSALRVDQP